MIHPTAKIHPTAIVEDGARVGARTIVMEFAIIRAVVEVGEDCLIMERVTLGALPVGYSGFKRVKPSFGVRVGNKVHFYTSSTIVSGLKRHTKIGDECAFGQQTTIGHDSIIGERVRINNHSTIAGFVRIGKYSRINLNCTIRERVKIGPYTVIGMGSNVTKDVPANCIAYGNPCRFIRKREKSIKHYARRIRDCF